LSILLWLLQVYALLDRVKAERQDHEVADVSQHQDNQAASPSDGITSDSENHSQHVINQDIILDDEGDIATLQLDAIDGDTAPEQKLPSVRKLRLPGASQRTSTLKLRKRSWSLCEISLQMTVHWCFRVSLQVMMPWNWMAHVGVVTDRSFCADSW